MEEVDAPERVQLHIVLGVRARLRGQRSSVGPVRGKLTWQGLRHPQGRQKQKPGVVRVVRKSRGECARKFAAPARLAHLVAALQRFPLHTARLMALPSV